MGHGFDTYVAMQQITRVGTFLNRIYTSSSDSLVLYANHCLVKNQLNTPNSWTFLGMVHNDSSHIQINNEVLGYSSQQFIPKSEKRGTPTWGWFPILDFPHLYHPTEESEAVEAPEAEAPEAEAPEAPEAPGANGEAPEVDMVPAEGTERHELKEAENVMETPMETQETPQETPLETPLETQETPLETPMETESQQDEAVAVPVASQAEEPKDVEMEAAPAAQAVEPIPEGRKDVVEVVDDDEAAEAEAAEAEAKDESHKRKAEPEDPPQATPDPPPSEHKQLGEKIRARG